MSVAVKLTSLPESVEDATIMTWYKNPGDPVKREEKLADIETDKVVLEINAETDGVLTTIHKNSGEIIVVGDLLAEIEAGEVPAETTVAAPPTEEKAESVPEPVPEPEEVAETLAETDSSDLTRFSPSARKIVQDEELDPSQISGSGRGGRVTKADVVAFMESGRTQPAAETSAPVESPKFAPAPVVLDETRPEQRVPMSRLRARVAERLVSVQQTTAMLTTFNEVNMQAVMDLRKKYRDSFEKEHGVRLGFMSFFVKACVEALKKYPSINASVDGTDIIYHGYFDVGIAMSTERGLMVPIIRDADTLSFADIEKAITDLAQRAGNNQITIEELTGGNFTITNGGVFGSMLSTPILNPPQSAIIGMHKIDPRPVAEEGQVVIRPMMYLALSYDHRIVDGREAVTFLVTIKDLIEDPARLMLSF